MSDEIQASGAVTRLEDVKPKMKFTGTVKKIELFGAFVDIGVGRDGLLHISALGPKRVDKVEDVVKVGDTVAVWVRRVDTKAGRIDLTLREPAALEWDEIKTGQVHTGKVTKIEKFGAFVDIGAERPGMVHISELATYRVEEVTEIVKVGQEVEVKVLGVDPQKRQIRLSMKALETMEVEADEAETPPLTAMQAAFQRAQAGAAAAESGLTPADKAKARRAREEQEDILSRTLANKRK